MTGRPLAVVLLSGGLDSTTVAAIAKAQGFAVLALTIDYNQRHRIELDHAARVADAVGVERHVVLPLDLRAFGGSALTADIAVPKDGVRPGIPVTYVPARNTVFLSVALAWAEAAGAKDLFIGVNALDFSGYPDCRPAFVHAFEAMANVATRDGGFTVHTPLIAMTKADIVREAALLGVDLALTWSCYDPTPAGRPCGECDFVPPAREGVCRGGRGRPGAVSYAVKELYVTLQGEGAQTGARAVFLRFAGCNLWSGREIDRATAVCTFCDTDFVGTDGPGGGKFADAGVLAAAVATAWGPEPAHRLVIATGGEPLLQLDTALVDALHGHGFRVGVETNGTQTPPPGLDWICVSPKADAPLVLTTGDELKLVYPQRLAPPERFADLGFDHFFLQPMDSSAQAANTRAAIDYCLANPRWRLGLQTHKLTGLP